MQCNKSNRLAVLKLPLVNILDCGLFRVGGVMWLWRLSRLDSCILAANRHSRAQICNLSGKHQVILCLLLCHSCVLGWGGMSVGGRSSEIREGGMPVGRDQLPATAHTKVVKWLLQMKNKITTPMCWLLVTMTKTHAEMDFGMFLIPPKGSNVTNWIVINPPGMAEWTCQCAIMRRVRKDTQSCNTPQSVRGEHKAVHALGCHTYRKGGFPVLENWGLGPSVFVWRGIPLTLHQMAHNAGLLCHVTINHGETECKRNI